MPCVATMSPSHQQSFQRASLSRVNIEEELVTSHACCSYRITRFMEKRGGMLEFPHTVSQAIIPSTSQTLLDIVDLSQCRPNRERIEKRNTQKIIQQRNANQSQATASTMHCVVNKDMICTPTMYCNVNYVATV
jgi:hypothetical protein